MRVDLEERMEVGEIRNKNLTALPVPVSLVHELRNSSFSPVILTFILHSVHLGGIHRIAPQVPNGCHFIHRV